MLCVVCCKQETVYLRVDFVRTVCFSRGLSYTSVESALMTKQFISAITCVKVLLDNVFNF